MIIGAWHEDAKDSLVLGGTVQGDERMWGARIASAEGIPTAQGLFLLTALKPRTVVVARKIHCKYLAYGTRLLLWN
jgi:hypothetical protein